MIIETIRSVLLMYRGVITRGVIGSSLLTVGGFGAGAIPRNTGILWWTGWHQWSFGHGAILALAVIWTGVALLVAAWLELGKDILNRTTGTQPHALAGPTPTAVSAVALAAWSAPLFFAAPMFSRDAYSYLAQGALVRDGFDPYQVGANANPNPLLLDVSNDWLNTTTPYGPLHLVFGELVTTVTGNDVIAGLTLLRITALIALVALFFSVRALATATQTDPALAIWMGVANPLVLLHLVAGLHNELLLLPLIVYAVVIALKGRIYSATILCAIAISIKVIPLLIAPFFLWVTIHQQAAQSRRSILLRLMGVGALLAACTLTTTALIAWCTGLGFGWIENFYVSDKVVNWLTLPTAIAHVGSLLTPVNFDVILAVLRGAMRLLAVAALIAIWWFSRRSDRSVMRGILAALVVFLALNSLAWPWYYTIPAVFLSACRPRLKDWPIIAGCIVFLSTVVGPNGSTNLYNPVFVALGLAASVLSTIWLRRRTYQHDNVVPARGLSTDRNHLESHSGETCSESGGGGDFAKRPSPERGA